MHPGPIRYRFSRRSISTFALLSLALLGIAGCTQDAYDPELRYAVRTDWLVAPGTWEIQPNVFNLPGHLPIDQLRETVNKPENEVSPDQLALRPYVGKKIFDPQKIPAEIRAEYGKNLDAMFGTPASPKVSGFNADALKVADESLNAEGIVQALRHRRGQARARKQTLSQPMPALPRPRRQRPRADRPLGESSAARLSSGNIQVHIVESRSRRPQAAP